MSEAVVVAREDRPGDMRLVAYVVVAAAESAPIHWCFACLYAGEAAGLYDPFRLCIFGYPATDGQPQGDRRALPAPDRMRPDLEEVFIAPGRRPRSWLPVFGVMF